jgi:hypothetical protein
MPPLPMGEAGGGSAGGIGTLPRGVAGPHRSRFHPGFTSIRRENKKYVDLRGEEESNINIFRYVYSILLTQIT